VGVRYRATVLLAGCRWSSTSTWTWSAVRLGPDPVAQRACVVSVKDPIPVLPILTKPGLRVRKREERLRILRVRPSTVLRVLRCRRRPVRSRTASSSTTSTGSRAVRTPRDSWPEEEDRLLTLRRAAAAIVWRPRPVTRRSAPPLSPDPRVAPRMRVRVRRRCWDPCIHRRRSFPTRRPMEEGKEEQQQQLLLHRRRPRRPPANHKLPISCRPCPSSSRPSAKRVTLIT